MYEGTLMSFVDRWVGERVGAGEIGAQTGEALRYRFKDLVAEHGHRPLAELDRATIDRWRQRIGGRSPATRRAYLSTVRVFCTWLVRHNLLSTDPTLDVPRVREPKHLPRARRAEEVAVLIEACRSSRDRLVVHLMVGLGLRCVEVAQLELGDYDEAAATIIVRGKFDAERMLPVPTVVAAAIRAYCDDIGWAAGPMIVSRRVGCSDGIGAARLSRVLAELMTETGLKRRPWDGAGAHSLRHTAASDVYARCRDPRVVQQMLGHASLTTTQRYLRRVEIDQLRTAMEGRDYRSAA